MIHTILTPKTVHTTLTPKMSHGGTQMMRVITRMMATIMLIRKETASILMKSSSFCCRKLINMQNTKQISHHL